jgi:hypothetical protein
VEKLTHPILNEPIPTIERGDVWKGKEQADRVQLFGNQEDCTIGG